MADNWREHPFLKGHLNAKYPDDISVWIQEQAGEPTFPPKFRTEMVWVRVTECNGNTIHGRVLNSPRLFKSVKEQQQIAAEILPSGRCVLIATPN